MKNKSTIILSVALVGSLAVNGYLLFTQNQNQVDFNNQLIAIEEKNNTLSSKIDSLSAENATLTNDLKIANATIETLPADNKEFPPVVDEPKETPKLKEPEKPKEPVKPVETPKEPVKPVETPKEPVKPVEDSGFGSNEYKEKPTEEQNIEAGKEDKANNTESNWN